MDRLEGNINSFATEGISYRNQSMDLKSKSVDWFLYDRDLRHERVNFHRRKLILSTKLIYTLQLSAKIGWTLILSLFTKGTKLER